VLVTVYRLWYDKNLHFSDFHFCFSHHLKDDLARMTTATNTTSLATALQHQLQALNLRQHEYELIEKTLQRPPNFTELVMFSALWSEHCSYKHSKHLLKTLPTTGACVVQGPGENAGIVDAGNGIHVAFKVESHNHPTYVEPFQGATTGVGGILRDIITLNARPVALLNALRFGNQQAKNPLNPTAASPCTEAELTGNRYRFARAVQGIAHYGNCMGVPTVAGDVHFHPCYTGNPLVNAMAVGIMQPSGLMLSGVKGVGNPVIYVGSPTGRDGIGGASFASRALDKEPSEADRPAVQVGDPFAEKCVMEACLEAFASGLVVSAQDMGAAGLTCATAEMAAKGGLGMEIDLNAVPAREPHMLAWEYLASESQERMLFILEKGKEAPVLEIFKKWQVPAVQIGTVIEPERLIVKHHGEVVVDLPTRFLTEDAPLYPPEAPSAEPAPAKTRRETPATQGIESLPASEVIHTLKALLGADNIKSRNPVYSQFDRHVQNATLLCSNTQTAGLIRLKQPITNQPTGSALAVALEGNPFYTYLNPYEGGKAIVAQAARNVACVGAKPLAATNNLNFGNPETTPVAFQMEQAVAGLGDACLALNTPITGGNVSLYNTNGAEAILPSPTLGMVGILNDETKTCTPTFQQAGHKIALVGCFNPTLGGSQYQWMRTNQLFGEPPVVPLVAEQALITLITQTWIPQGLLASVQDLAVGGLLPTLTKSCFNLQNATATPLGAKLDFTISPLLQTVPRLDTLLFGETHASYIISYPQEQEALLKTTLQAAANNSNSALQFHVLGDVTADEQLTLVGLVETPIIGFTHSFQQTWEGCF
jgi:phosphoribosylformylglycinamidine synthase II